MGTCRNLHVVDLVTVIVSSETRLVVTFFRLPI